MLLEFSVENYRSIKEKATLSMIATREESLKENLFNYKDISVLKSAAIYGSNASGKTNILKALNFVSSMVTSSNKNQVGDLIAVEPFKLDDRSIGEPSKFEIVFVKNDVKYIYGFSANKNKIVEEHLYHYPFDRKRIIFERMDGEDPHFVRDPKKQREIFSKTLENALYLSTSANWNYKDSLIAMEWFKETLWTFDLMDILGNTIPSVYTIKDLADGNENADLIRALLSASDMGIADLKVVHKDISEDELKFFAEDIRNDFIKSSGGRISRVVTYRKNEDTKEMVSFELDEESGGFKRMLELAGPLVNVLLKGGVLILDEFEIRLHPHLSVFLLKLFHNKETNKKDAQLVFTTHNTYFMKHDILRKDQIWFTEKKQNQSTDLYSLADFKPRNDENIEKRYSSGRYGGIPFIDEWIS